MDKAVYDPYVKPEILEILIKCMRRVVNESPPAYREAAEMMLKLLERPNKSGMWPETFFAMSNRVGGKTYSFGKCLMYAAMDYEVKIGLYCRKMKKMGKYASGVFQKVVEDCYEGWTMKEKKVSDIYTEIWMYKTGEEGEEPKHIGYVLPLNSDSDLKDCSSEISKVEVMLMDEFQSSDSVPDETDKFINIHDTVARGISRDGVNYGVRYLPTIMLSNSLSITNKYLALYHLMDKIQSNTKFYRGEGVSLLRFKNEAVAENQAKTAFHRSIKGANILESNIDNAWLNDSGACVAKPDNWGQSYYVCTVIDGDTKYGVSWYPRSGLYYVNRSIDETDPNVFNITPGGVENVTLLRRTGVFISLRKAYMNGCCRFSDQPLKSVAEKWFL